MRRTALDFGMQTRPDLVCAGRRLEQLQAHFERSPSRFVEQTPRNIPQSELRFAALEIGASRDAKISACRKPIVVGLSRIAPAEQKCRYDCKKGEPSAKICFHKTIPENR